MRKVLGAAAVLLLAAGLIYFVKHRPTVVHGGPCPGETVELEMKDPYLRGVLEQGQHFRAVLNWYACRPLERGDRVLYRFSGQADPVVRIARAVPGDRFELLPHPKLKAWNIKINGELLMDSTRSGRGYFFGSEAPPTLSLYEKPRKGLLGPGEAIVFSSFPPGDRDSGALGLVAIDDLIAKVVDPASK